MFLVPQIESIEAKEGALELRRESTVRPPAKVTFQTTAENLDYSVPSVFPQVFMCISPSVRHVLGTGAKGNKTWSHTRDHYLLGGG